ncbi:YmfQ family protein [Muricoccus aerilatus]|uniref:YmfQ family protein n=1 Tax=Muricoccus aerilatus TaxID=452982 RepID=UPI0005C1F905|nr:putative phage tail protein [Roseomonas aerilata]
MIAGTVAEYARSILDHLPRGRVWPRDPDSTVATTARGLAPTFQRLDARALTLLKDAFPASAYELLPEWEASLGLPDPCSGPAPTVQLRRAQVVARLTANGGQAIPYFIEVAAALGYDISIEEFAPARAGTLRAGDPLYGEDWAHTWRVHAPAVTVTYFTAGISTAGEPLAAWDNRSLECTLSRIRPAHTILQFAYGS